jgi:prepilin peptidase CpaA
MREAMQYLPMFVLLAWAAVVDVRARRIPNWLTGALALGGLIQAAAGMGAIGFGQAGMGFLAGFALTFVFFALGGMGAGDVKLFAAIGAWVGPVGVVQVFVVERVVGLVVVLVQSARAGRLGAVLRGSAVLAASAVVTRDVTCLPAEAGGENEKLTRLPYAVPTLMAAALVMAARWRWL